MQQDDLVSVVITLVLVFTIIFLGTFVANETLATGTDSSRVNTHALLDGTSWTTIDDSVGQNEEVYNSLGFAVNLTGADDSYAQTTQSISLSSDETWTVSVWAHVDPAAASSNMTAVSANGRLLINYNGTAGEWRAWYYDEGSRHSYQVSVAEQGPATALENVVVARNGSTLTIYANTTAGTTADLTTANSQPAPTEATNLDGRLEETRISDTAWNASIRSSHYSTPIDPLPVNRSARIMYDEPYRDSQLIFYSPASLETNNATFAAGLPGSELTAGTDYEFQTDGPTLVATDTGALADAPVAYVDYTVFGGLVNTYTNGLNAVFAILGLVFVIVPLGLVVYYLRGTGGGMAR